MKEVLEKWSGKYVIDDEIYTDLHNFNPKDGDEFHIVLLSRNRKVDDAKDLLSAN